MITRTDNFDRASLGTNWEQGQIVGSYGEIVLYNSDDYMASCTDFEPRANWIGDVCHPDQRAQCVVSNVRASNWQHYVGVSCRGFRGTSKTFYGFQCDVGSMYVFSMVRWTPTILLNGGSGGVSAGDVLKLETVGTAIKAWVNAGSVVDTTDSSIATGQVGIEGYCDGSGPYTGSDTTRADSWEASWEEVVPLYLDRSTEVAKGTGSSISQAIDVNASANLLLVTVVGYLSGGWSVSTCTFDGQAMTLFDARTHGTNNAVRAEVWKLANPPSGSKTLSITLSGTVAPYLVGAIAFKGAGDLGAVSWNYGGATVVAPNVQDVASAAGEYVLDVLGYFGGNEKWADAGQQDLLNMLTSSGGDYGDGASSFKAGAATVDMSYSVTGQDNSPWVMLAFSVKNQSLSFVNNTLKRIGSRLRPAHFSAGNAR